MPESPTLTLAKQICRFRTSLDLIEHWLSKQPQQDSLEIPEFDPIDVPGLLPNIYLLEKIDGRLKYRVSGENVNSLFGRQNTGRYLDEVVPPHLYEFVHPYFYSIFSGNLVVFGGMVVVSNKEYLEFERVLLPVRRKGETRLLGMLSLTDTAKMRDDAPPPRPKGGYTFHCQNLATGTIGEFFHEVTPIKSPQIR
ncbi:PAS domain-containing protein [Hwanghaeella sp. LZ110]|uniref:PAS domain-containing protein n=1 Tax=Hwanghaeella sp. LZ110 TaxID=3402810 RepID=UPI003B676DF0